MFPRSARPCCIYKLRFPLGCDGDLKRFLQNEPSVENGGMFLLHSRKGRVQMAGKKRRWEWDKRNEPFFIARLNFNLLPLAFWEGNGSSQSPWSVASCPVTQLSTTAARVFGLSNTVRVYSTSTRQHYIFLRRLQCLVSPTPTDPREFVMLWFQHAAWRHDSFLSQAQNVHKNVPCISCGHFLSRTIVSSNQLWMLEWAKLVFMITVPFLVIYFCFSREVLTLNLYHFVV